jgi:hypothetical protein
VTAAADAAGAVVRAGTTSTKHLLVIGAVLAAALLAGCGGSGGSNDQTYAIGPTTTCLHEEGERAVRHPNDRTTLTLEWAYLRFHPSVDDAKSFDVTALNTNFGGYQYHRKRYGNVSLIWATGGRRNVKGPNSEEIDTVERCLRA